MPRPAGLDRSRGHRWDLVVVGRAMRPWPPLRSV